MIVLGSVSAVRAIRLDLSLELETTTLKRGYAFYTRDKTKEKIGPRTRAETVPKMTLNGGWTRGVRSNSSGRSKTCIL